MAATPHWTRRPEGGFEVLEWTGVFVPRGTPQQFGKFVQAEAARWGAPVKSRNIKAE